MQQGLTSSNTRQEIAEAIRFQQSLLRLGNASQRPAPRKPAARHSMPQERQLAAWADQLSTARAAS